MFAKLEGVLVDFAPADLPSVYLPRGEGFRLNCL
jgi:hypothetical protein